MRWQGGGHGNQGGVALAQCARLSFLVIPLLLTSLPLGLFTPAATPALGTGSGVAVAGPSLPVLPNETLAVRNFTDGNLSDFWGAGLNPGYNLTNVTNETHGTPVNWVVWPAGDVADTFNMTNGTTWTNGVSTHILNNESQFVAACRAISCHAIFTVPGEIDNPAVGAYEVWYTQQVLHFQPAYWEIGNEPSRWQHFGQNWTQWNTTPLRPPTALQYAQVVNAYIAAMRAINSSLQFIGLPGVGNGAGPDELWITDTVELNGPNLSAVAVHDYPGEDGTANATLTKFYGSLTAAKTYMVTRFGEDEKAIRAAESNISCTNCSIRFFVDEFGAATQLSNYQVFLHSYAEIPYVTAELLMMTESNVSNADLFELRSNYNGSLFTGVGSPFPLDSLYTQILPHYDTIPLNTTVTGTQKGVFAGVAESPATNSMTLLAVNTNTTQAVQLNVAGSVFPSDGTYEAWLESNSTSVPNGTVTQSSGTYSGSNWVLPPLDVLLVSVCRSNASLGSGGLHPVSFCATGLTSGTQWSVTVGSTTVNSTGGTITIPEPNGTYAYRIGAVAGWTTASPGGNITVSGAPASIQVPWAEFTYPVTFNETGLPSGTSWFVNLSGTLYRSNLTQLTGYESNGTHPYVLPTVSGWRPQNVTGIVSVNATSTWVEVNWTQVTYVVTLHQRGLSNVTNWSADLAGLVMYNATGGTLRFVEPNGTYSYTVGSVPGYTPDATSGVVTVRGYSKLVPLTFANSSAVYSIQFNESNLPVGTSWNVSLNGTGQSGTASNFAFFEPNGTYSYSLGGAPGWSPPAYTKGVTVSGTPVFEVISYTEVTYNVTFHETGLPTPLLNGSWSVTLNGTRKTSMTPTIAFLEPNGTVNYTIGPEPGYTTNSCIGSVQVDGRSASCTVKWTAYLSSVTFAESGLHSTGGATTWTLDVTGRDPRVNFLSNPTLVEGFANGSYNFTATTSVVGMGLDPTVGNFIVTGRPVSVPVTFAPVFTVSFVASGLPPAFEWSVDVNGSVSWANASTIRVVEPNGTYNYTVPGVNGLVRTPASGQVRVNGGTALVAISFRPSTSPVTFTESGLVGGTNWSVALNGTNGTLTNYSYGGTSVIFELVNGSYTYLVNPVLGYRIGYATGNFSEVGQVLSFNVTFIPTFYNVTFSANGLPHGTNWSVTLGAATSYSDGGSTISFMEVNGSYSFNDSTNDSRYAPSYYHSTLVVNGSPILENLTFREVNYTVNFTESGLPGGGYWYLTFNGTNKSVLIAGPGPNIISFVGEVNGTYAYEIYDFPGYQQTNISHLGNLTVAGQSIAVVLEFTPVSYRISFGESGLPAGKNWSVTCNGTSESKATTGGNDTLVFRSMPNGSYLCSIVGISGWHESSVPYSGTVTVDGGPVTVNVTFLPVTYEVTYSESGLPFGLDWSVTVDGVTHSLLTDGGTDTLTWTGLANGSFAYGIQGLAGWEQSSLRYHGSLYVSGGLDSVNGSEVGYAANLDYQLVTYAVTFQAGGLPVGTPWSVTAEGSTLSSFTTSIQFELPNGTFPFTISNVANYSRNATGSLEVTGEPVRLAVSFALVKYAVTWTETGLPAGTNWSVTISGTTVTSTTGQIVFLLANGSVSWSGSGLPGYSMAPENGTVVVQGATQAVSIVFVAPPERYLLTFAQTGLPPNTNWSVSIGSVTRYSMRGANIVFQEPNGTFNFTIGPILGYSTSVATGSVILDGTASSVSVRFVPTGVSPPPSRGISALDWAVVIGVTALVVIMLVLSLAMRRSGRSKDPGAGGALRPPGPNSPTSQGTSSGPRSPGNMP